MRFPCNVIVPYTLVTKRENRKSVFHGFLVNNLTARTDAGCLLYSTHSAAAVASPRFRRRRRYLFFFQNSY